MLSGILSDTVKERFLLSTIAEEAAQARHPPLPTGRRADERRSCDAVSEHQTEAAGMIIDVQRFVQSERGYWEELESALKRLEEDPYRKLDLDALRRFHYLYERASAETADLFFLSSKYE
jgi:hypothetical protein